MATRCEEAVIVTAREFVAVVDRLAKAPPVEQAAILKSSEQHLRDLDIALVDLDMERVRAAEGEHEV